MTHKSNLSTTRQTISWFYISKKLFQTRIFNNTNWTTVSRDPVNHKLIMASDLALLQTLHKSLPTYVLMHLVFTVVLSVSSSSSLAGHKLWCAFFRWLRRLFVPPWYVNLFPQCLQTECFFFLSKCFHTQTTAFVETSPNHLCHVVYAPS